MVQQPFNGGPLVGPAAAVSVQQQQQQQQQQQIQPPVTLNTSIGSVGPASQQHSQYSPQADFYQQQLIKGAHQFVKQQQQQQQHNSALRLASNGLSPVAQANQQLYGQTQDSPQQQQVESLYNGIARQQAPIYAPKPTYYGQVPTQAAMFQAANSQMQTHANFYGQQQASSNGLTVRQLPMQLNGILAPAPNLSPLQQATQSNPQMHTQLFQNSYLGQQQANGSLDMIQVANSAAYLSSASSIPKQPQAQRVAELAVRWPIDEQTGATRSGQTQHPAAAERTSRRANPSARPNFSDRDSISTVSRFNQFDERRSMTMRSQYTNNQRANSLGNSNRFGFLELTGEALKRVLGKSSSSPNGKTATDLEKQKLQNMSLIAASSGGQQTVGKMAALPTSPASMGKVTLTIDSGEDYFFRRKVLKYQLVILRTLNILCCAFVLLSPVVMLLVPKMEPFFHPVAQDYTSDLGAPESSQTSTPSVAHAVGLSGPSRNHHHPPHQTPYLALQPQWRISDCSTDCDGPMIGFVVRLIMLALAYWAIMLRPQTASLPRIDFYRCLLVSLAVLLTLAYWLFFLFRVFDKRFNDFELQYMTIVQFSVSMLESLILLHYLAIVLIELRHRKKVYCLKVIRSPDGASRYYNCGPLSIQKCAQFVLEKYHRDFKSYSQYSEQLDELEGQQARAFLEARDGLQADDERERSRPSSPANSHRGASSARRSSRHHSRSNHQRDDRSPSPARSTRSRSHRRDDRARSTSTKYQLDAKSSKLQDEQSARNPEKMPKNVLAEATTATTSNNNNNNSSAEQSSDANTNPMKESSLETIRAANSSSDLLIGNQPAQKQSKPSNARDGGDGDPDGNENDGDNEDEAKSRRVQHAHQARDETESLRSARSRRSTARSSGQHGASRHHSHHRERSSSRANQRPSNAIGDSGAANQVEEHERKVRRRKLRLLVAVEDAFEQMKRADDEGKCCTVCG